MKRIIDILRENALFILLVILIIFPFLLTAFFSVPCQDDFMIYHRMSIEEGSNVLIKSLKAVWTIYNDWTGGMPWVFYEFLFNPLNYATAWSHLVGIYLQFSFVSFLIVMYVWIQVICSDFFNTSNRLNQMIYLVIVAAFLNLQIYSQVIYWFIGNVYMWVCTMAMLTHIVMVRYFSKYSKASFLELIILGFVTCFNYQIAMTLGFLYLLEMFKNRRKKVIDWIPLACMALGGLISVLAPGNFTRYNEVNGSFSVKATIAYAIADLGQVVIKCVTNSFCIAFLMCVFIVGALGSNKEYKVPHPAVMVMAEFLSILWMVFIMAWGQGNSVIYDRMAFLINFCVIMSSIITFGYLGKYISLKYPCLCEEPLKRTILTVCVGACLCNVGIYVQQDDIPWKHTINELENVRESASSVRNLYKSISGSGDEDYIIYDDDFEINTDLLPGLYLGDKNHWVNEDMAYYFNKKSIDCE